MLSLRSLTFLITIYTYLCLIIASRASDFYFKECLDQLASNNKRELNCAGSKNDQSKSAVVYIFLFAGKMHFAIQLVFALITNLVSHILVIL